VRQQTKENLILFVQGAFDETLRLMYPKCPNCQWPGAKMSGGDHIVCPNKDCHTRWHYPCGQLMNHSSCPGGPHLSDLRAQLAVAGPQAETEWRGHNQAYTGPPLNFSQLIEEYVRYHLDLTQSLETNPEICRVLR
jgi:hypothetical protein